MPLQTVSTSGKKPETTPAPSQTVGRAIQLLRLIASSQSRNLRLVELAERAELDKSTAHRLLQRLLYEGMVVRDADARGYRLGPLLQELGLATLPCCNLREVAAGPLEALAKSTGDMTFLVKRSGFETVCLERVTGAFAIQTLTQDVGDRHPLGVGAGGLAILASLTHEEAAIVLRAVAPQLRRYKLTEKILTGRVDVVRECGLALDEGSAAMDVTAVGQAIHNAAGSPLGAVFVASIRSRMTKARIGEAARKIAACVQTIESRLRE